MEGSISEICIGAVPYQFTELVKIKFPQLINLIGKSFDLRTNVFDKLNEKLFFDYNGNGKKVKIYGLKNKKRAEMWIDPNFISKPNNFENYKILISKASGSGKFGEILSASIISEPNTGHTQSFISIGKFNTLEEAINLEKYIKTKFCRCMLGVLKTTQDINPSKWLYVPIQNFSPKSDINWSTSISNIDAQLYKKYGLNNEEINFIENNVMEMD